MPNLDLRYPCVRFMAAFCQFLPGPIIFPDPSTADTLTHATVLQARPFLIAMGPLPTLTLEEIAIIVTDTQRDAIVLKLCPDTSNPFRFDIIMHSAGRTELYSDYRLYLSADRRATLLPPRHGEALYIGNSGPIPTGAMPYADRVERMEGVGRANAALAMMVGSVLVPDEASGL